MRSKLRSKRTQRVLDGDETTVETYPARTGWGSNYGRKVPIVYWMEENKRGLQDLKEVHGNEPNVHINLMAQPSDQGKLESALFRIMTLLATLSAATEVKYRIEERKAGRDASEQEDEEFATSFLYEAEDELRTSLVNLRAGFILKDDASEDLISNSVRRFSDLSRLHGMCSLLQRMHQRMLSLYPSISEELVEEARQLITACEALLELDDEKGVPPFVQRALQFCDNLIESL